MIFYLYKFYFAFNAILFLLKHFAIFLNHQPVITPENIKKEVEYFYKNPDKLGKLSKNGKPIIGMVTLGHGGLPRLFSFSSLYWQGGQSPR